MYGPAASSRLRWEKATTYTGVRLVANVLASETLGTPARRLYGSRSSGMPGGTATTSSFPSVRSDAAPPPAAALPLVSAGLWPLALGVVAGCVSASLTGGAPCSAAYRSHTAMVPAEQPHNTRDTTVIHARCSGGGRVTVV